MRKILTAVGLVAGFALAGLTATTGSAAANPGPPAPPPCTGVTLNSTTGVTLVAGGKATATKDGLLLETTVEADGVVWVKALDASIGLGSVNRLQYATRKLDDGTSNAAALPAYRLYLTDMDGPNATTTLIYEPYWQITGNPALDTWATWNARTGKWWSSKTIAGQTAGAGGPAALRGVNLSIESPGIDPELFGIYTGSAMNLTYADVEHRMSHYPPSDQATILAHEVVRQLAKAHAKALCDILPAGREKSLVLTALEEALMWSNAAIARNQGPAPHLGPDELENIREDFDASYGDTPVGISAGLEEGDKGR